MDRRVVPQLPQDGRCSSKNFLRQGQHDALVQAQVTATPAFSPPPIASPACRSAKRCSSTSRRSRRSSHSQYGSGPGARLQRAAQQLISKWKRTSAYNSLNDENMGIMRMLLFSYSHPRSRTSAQSTSASSLRGASAAKSSTASMSSYRTSRSICSWPRQRMLTPPTHAAESSGRPPPMAALIAVPRSTTRMTA